MQMSEKDHKPPTDQDEKDREEWTYDKNPRIPGTIWIPDLIGSLIETPEWKEYQKAIDEQIKNSPIIIKDDDHG